jgi:GrpB-like predicted nucleotidyltransferase (UPF0157 family)
LFPTPDSGDWPRVAAELAGALRDALGGAALRVEHIGSTSIPGMAAKDILDMQVSVANLARSDLVFGEPLARLGFVRMPFLHDHVPAGCADDPGGSEKRVWRRRGRVRDVNLHVRLAGSANERLALLFLDWFRAHPAAVPAFKRALADAAPDLEPCTTVKNPAVDLVVAAAGGWVAATGWQP